MMLVVNYVIYGCSPARETPGVSPYRNFTLEENIVAVITQDRVVDDNLTRQIEKQSMCTCRLFLLNWFFPYISFCQNWFSFYPIVNSW